MVTYAIPKLSEDLPHKRIGVCQGCGREPGGQPLTALCEYDEFGRRTSVYVLICDGCWAEHGVGHPRKYLRGPANTIMPGGMPICETCKHRSGVRCLKMLAGVDALFFQPEQSVQAMLSPNGETTWWAILDSVIDECSGKAERKAGGEQKSETAK